MRLCKPITLKYCLVHGESSGLTRLSLQLIRDLIFKDIWGLISSIAQSARRIDIEENFDVCVFNIAAPANRGRKSNRKRAKT